MQDKKTPPPPLHTYYMLELFIFSAIKIKWVERGGSCEIINATLYGGYTECNPLETMSSLGLQPRDDNVSSGLHSVC